MALPSEGTSGPKDMPAKCLPQQKKSHLISHCRGHILRPVLYSWCTHPLVENMVKDDLSDHSTYFHIPVDECLWFLHHWNPKFIFVKRGICTATLLISLAIWLLMDELLLFFLAYCTNAQVTRSTNVHYQPQFQLYLFFLPKDVNTDVASVMVLIETLASWAVIEPSFKVT